MTVHYYIQRPDITATVQWTGDNLAEIQSAFPTVSFTDNGDGTITYDAGENLFTGQPTVVVVATGQWILSAGGSMPQVYDQNTLAGSQQEVISPGPFDYTVTEVAP